MTIYFGIALFTSHNIAKASECSLSLTCSGLWRSELQRVAQDIVVVPHIQLIVSRVVADRGDVLVWVGKSNAYRLNPFSPCVVGIEDKIPTRLAVIILVDRANSIQDAACHKCVRCHTLLKACLPRAFKT